MADQQQRRVRLRLARQGTAPARVRARVRDDQQLTDTNPEQQTRKRIPWVHIGTVIGAVAAIGSLVFSGVATYYGAVVAQKQLEQSREDNEMRERDQATRVTFWEENSFWGEGRAIHLVNRSPDPVTNLDVRINATYKGKGYLLLLSDTNLPPCTEIVFKVAKQQALLDDGRQVSLADLTGWNVALFAFEDSAGKAWSRGATFLVRGNLGSATARSWKGTGLVKASEPQVKNAEPCGEKP